MATRDSPSLSLPFHRRCAELIDIHGSLESASRLPADRAFVCVTSFGKSRVRDRLRRSNLARARVIGKTVAYFALMVGWLFAGCSSPCYIGSLHDVCHLRGG